MNDPIFSSIMGVASSAMTGLINDSFAKSNAREQRDWQEKMWHEQNEYNTPANMANRMRAAGLNPFAATEAQPAGSAGTGVKADSGYFQNPIESLLGLAQIRNLNAQANHTETDAEKLVQEIENLKIIGRTLGWTEKETEQRVKNYVEEAMKRNEFTLANDNTEADSEEKKASASEHTAGAELKREQSDLVEEEAAKAKSERLFTEALTATENALRDARVQTEKAKAAAENANASAALAQANKLIQEGKLVENQVQRDAFKLAAETFYGFTFDGIDPELVATFLAYYSDVYSGKMDATTALNNAMNDLQLYIDRELYVPNSKSSNNGFSLAWGLISMDRARSRSGSTPDRTPNGAATRW